MGTLCHRDRSLALLFCQHLLGHRHGVQQSAIKFFGVFDLLGGYTS